MYKKLTPEEKRLRKLRRSTHPETLESLIESWRSLAERGKKIAARHAEEEDYEAAAQNSWIATGFLFCAQDLEDTIFLMNSSSDWKPPV